MPRERPAFCLVEGAEVVFVNEVEQLWHLPAPGGAESLTRRTLCGLKGPVYAYGAIARRRRCCSVCAKRAPRGTFLPQPKPRRTHPRSVPQFTDPQVELFRRIYEDKHVGIPTIAELVWEKLGFRNPRSCSNAIHRAFTAREVPIRTRADSVRRSPEALRFRGVGGRQPGEQKLTGGVLDELYELYQQGQSVPEIAATHADRLGYSDQTRFRSALEYGWKALGYRLRSNRDAELLSRAKSKRRCIAMTTGNGGYRRRPCPQRPRKGSDYCYWHDPAFEEERNAQAAAMRERIPREPALDFDEIPPWLEPLLLPRPDRFGRQLETASGALARNTGMDPAVCSRLLKGTKRRISETTADRLLSPLGLTLAAVRSSEEVIAA